MDLKHTGVSEFLSWRHASGMLRDPLYRNSFFMAFTSVFNAGCGFFFWMIAARLYTVEQVGLATALISALGLVVLLSRLGFDVSAIRFFPIEDRGRVVSTSLLVTTGACILAGIAYLLSVHIFAPSMLFLREPRFAVAFLLIGAASSAAAVTGNAFIADRRAEQYFMQNLLMALRIPALVPLVSLGVFGIFGCVGLAYVLAFLFGFAMLQRSFAMRPAVDMGFVSRSFRYSAWSYASSILSNAPTLVLPIMILNILGEAEAAKYYVTFAIGNLVLIIPGSLGTSLFVEGSHGSSLKRGVYCAGAASLALLVPTVAVLVIMGDRLLGLLRGEYVEAFGLLRIVALSSFFVAAYSFFVPIQNVRMRVESVVRINALRCVLMLLLSYILMQRYGIMGAGYAWMATYVAVTIAAGWVAWREGWWR